MAVPLPLPWGASASSIADQPVGTVGCCNRYRVRRASSGSFYTTVVSAYPPRVSLPRLVCFVHLLPVDFRLLQGCSRMTYHCPLATFQTAACPRRTAPSSDDFSTTGCLTFMFGSLPSGLVVLSWCSSFLHQVCWHQLRYPTHSSQEVWSLREVVSSSPSASTIPQ